MVNPPLPAGPARLTATIDVFFTSLVEHGSSSLRAQDFLDLATQAKREQDQPLASAATRLASLLSASALPLDTLDLHLRASLEHLRLLVDQAGERQAAKANVGLKNGAADRSRPEADLRDDPEAVLGATDSLRRRLALWRLSPVSSRPSPCKPHALERAFVVRLAHQRYLVAVSGLSQIELERSGNADEASVVRLGALLQLPAIRRKLRRGLLLRLVPPGNEPCFAVDAIVSQGDFLIHPLPRMLTGHPVFSGCAILPGGKIALLLDLAALSQCCSTGLRR